MPARRDGAAATTPAAPRPSPTAEPRLSSSLLQILKVVPIHLLSFALAPPCPFTYARRGHAARPCGSMRSTRWVVPLTPPSTPHPPPSTPPSSAPTHHSPDTSLPGPRRPA